MWVTCLKLKPQIIHVSGFFLHASEHVSTLHFWSTSRKFLVYMEGHFIIIFPLQKGRQWNVSSLLLFSWILKCLVYFLNLMIPLEYFGKFEKKKKQLVTPTEGGKRPLNSTLRQHASFIIKHSMTGVPCCGTCMCWGSYKLLGLSSLGWAFHEMDCLSF
jgi:hypothetical protein